MRFVQRLNFVRLIRYIPLTANVIIVRQSGLAESNSNNALSSEKINRIH